MRHTWFSSIKREIANRIMKWCKHETLDCGVKPVTFLLKQSYLWWTTSIKLTNCCCWVTFTKLLLFEENKTKSPCGIWYDRNYSCVRYTRFKRKFLSSLKRSRQFRVITFVIEIFSLAAIDFCVLSTLVLLSLF